jgi:putative ABC transport system substrate-binding protein
MRRREFFCALGGAVATLPLSVRAQQGEPIRRIGVLSSIAEDDPEAKARVAAFEDGLSKLGWKVGRNLRIDYRWGRGDADRLRPHAAELVRLSPDVLFAIATTALMTLHRETRTIPIVFAQVVDPVSTGAVTNLARPGGNVTGFAQYEYNVGIKWLELLKEIAPRVVRVAVLHDPGHPSSTRFLPAISSGAYVGVNVADVPARNSNEIKQALASFAREPHAGLIVLPGPLTVTHRELIIALAAQHRLPAIYAFRFFVTSGGLASYGVDNIELYRRAASYVDRILKGEKPADLPVQAATKFELVINLKTAKALELDPPITLLARTDEAIE